MSGFKLAKQIRNIRPDIPILFMTAFDTVDLEYKDVFPSSDSKQFISKPVSMVKLEQLIFSYIKKVG
jgi:two-component SAPR family response regulator